MNWDNQEQKWEDTESIKEKSIIQQQGFFTNLKELLNSSTYVTLKVGVTGEDNLIVSVLPGSVSSDEALKKLAPLTIKGTAKELDEQFFDALGSVKQFAEFSADALSFEKSVAKAKEESEMSKKQKEEKKKLKEKVEKLVTEANEAFEAKDTEKMRSVINKIAAADPKNKTIAELNSKITEIDGNTLF